MIAGSSRPSPKHSECCVGIASACASTAGLKPTNSSPPGEPPASGQWNIPYFANLTRPTRFLRYQHEQAYLLAKGEPALPDHPIADVLEMRYTGNHLHPTQKLVSALLPLIETFSAEGDLVLDSYCSSGSTPVAARQLHRFFIGIEFDSTYHALATRRIQAGAAQSLQHQYGLYWGRVRIRTGDVQLGNPYVCWI